MIWFWIALGLVGLLFYISIGYCSYRFLHSDETDKDFDILLAGILWPLGWFLLLVMLPSFIIKEKKYYKKLLFLPNLLQYFRKRKERKRQAKEQKLSEAHEANPLQTELNRYQELQSKIPETRETLRDLEIEFQELGAKLELDGGYRQPDAIRLAREQE
ncbi:hypothetical protein KJ885_01195 [Patescibacteria group bacterium]|nr:hypothetical protein [Patescibacteria group bacterium]